MNNIQQDLRDRYKDDHRKMRFVVKQQLLGNIEDIEIMLSRSMPIRKRRALLFRLWEIFKRKAA